MAVASQTTSGDSGVWWSSWISSAKEKSVSALNATKRDLAEFVSVLGNDTKAAVKGASENIRTLVQSPQAPAQEQQEKKEEVSAVVDVNSDTPYDRCQAELLAVQRSSETYLQDPVQGTKEFEEWKSSFNIESYQNDISSLLVSCSHVRKMHSQLVPVKVSYEAFWTRYFYRIQQLQKEERQREDLMARATNRVQEQLEWDEEVEDVIGSPLVVKVEGSGHQRSASSTDSFVCVSEETGLEVEAPSSRGTADNDSWEHLGSDLGGSGSRGSRAKLSEMGEVESNGEGSGNRVKNLLKERESLLRSIELLTDSKGKTDDGGDSSSSDWENWED